MADVFGLEAVSEDARPKWKRRPRKKLDMKAAKSNIRDRKDSGCCSDDGMSPNDHSNHGQESPDMTFLHWNEIIFNWSAKSHSIVQQEFERMQVMTERKAKEITFYPERKAKIVEEWKQEVQDIMGVTQDLIQCVANDIVEVNSSSDEEDSRRPSTTLTSQELGKILEEELFEQKSSEEEENEKVYLVRAKKGNKKSKKSKAKKESANGDGKEMWAARRSFTLEVEELERKNRKRPRATKTGMEEWNMDLESPIVWDDNEVTTECEAEAEDILADWNRLLSKQSRMNRKDIEEVFWDISLGKRNRRPRRFSEVLDNLPFDDHPDVYGDRCEILEASKKRKERQARKRPAKLYWNIFDEWKRNLDEERAMRRKQQRNRRQRRRPKQRYPRKNKTPEREPKTHEARKRGVRRGREEEAPPRNFKRQRTADWKNIRNESERSLRAITKNIEAKIREAFEDSEEPELSRLEVDFQRMVSNSTEEFCLLRDQVRAMRKENQIRLRRQSPLLAFSEWSWNLAEKDESEESQLILNSSTEEFCLLRDQVRGMRRENKARCRRHSYLTSFQEWKWHLAQNDDVKEFVLVTPAEEIFDGFVGLVQDDADDETSDDEGFDEMTEEQLKRRTLKKQLKEHKKLIRANMQPICNDHISGPQFLDCPKNRACRKLNANSAFKAQKKLQAKCHPKQPMVRGRN